MHILIMRHGEAASIEGDDSLRPLTDYGINETKKMGQWLSKRNISLFKIFVSPYLRAQQSCKHITNALEKSATQSANIPETIDIITPSGNANQVHDFIDGLIQESNVLTSVNCEGDNNAILFVSHMPFISYLVGELTNTVNMPIFCTGAIATIDYDIKAMQGTLIDMTFPDSVSV